jgi:hypothetical protein
MATIDFSDPTSLARDRAASGPLGRAAMAALGAPSILNTQPWQWRLHHDTAELWADRTRRLPALDPDGRLLTLSCGIALHHAATALAADGHTAEITRLPDPARPDLLAVARTGGRHRPDPADIRAYQSMQVRHTDRRASTGGPIPAAQLGTLRAAAEAHGAHVHVLRDEQVPELIVAAQHAADLEAADPGTREELALWTHRPPGAGDGVPAETVVPASGRRVSARPFLPDADAGLAPGAGTDKTASYAILFTDTDTPAAWLAAGEALSALLLAATGAGVGVTPLSHVIEVGHARQLLTGMLCGLGHPVLALRLAITDPTTPPPTSPRRTPDDTITRR